MVVDTGELMLASFPFNELGFVQSISPSNPWYCAFMILFIAKLSKRWLGEKYDGVRFSWNANDQAMHLYNNIVHIVSFTF